MTQATKHHWQIKERLDRILRQRGSTTTMAEAVDFIEEECQLDRSYIHECLESVANEIRSKRNERLPTPVRTS